ncbi:MAG: ribosome biogenesis GTP-binding protein YihA/YsxC [Oscillospiraceae bacterium]|nr:ribosome biogenesis GTP-binding protein YihA/YsxC [Oscillospiraceae bacterium]
MNKLNWHNAQIMASYGKFSQLPALTLPEIAFSGRSNVGKSSLINKLLNRKSLARVSSRPGKTITINCFDIDGKIFVVDLPGYGYAKISKSEKERFGRLAEMYLQSDRIALLVQLIDFRHPPSKDDVMMLDFLRETDTPHVIVLTKADKLKKRERERMREVYKDWRNIVEFSSETGEGVEELRAIIEEYSQ